MNYFVDGDDNGLTLVATPGQKSPLDSSFLSTKTRKSSTIYLSSAPNSTDKAAPPQIRRHSMAVHKNFVGIPETKGMRPKAASMDDAPVFIADFYDDDDVDDLDGVRTTRSPTIVSRAMFEKSNKCPEFSMIADVKTDAAAVPYSREQSSTSSSGINLGALVGDELSPPIVVESTVSPLAATLGGADDRQVSSAPLTPVNSITSPNFGAENLHTNIMDSRLATALRSTPPPAVASNGSSMMRLFDRQLSVNDQPITRPVVASSLSTPQLERTWRFGSADLYGPSVPLTSLPQVGWNSMTNGRFPYVSNGSTCSTSSLYGPRPLPSASGVTLRPSSASVVIPFSSSAPPLNAQKSTFFAQNGCKSVGGADAAVLTGSPTASSTLTGLRHNKSRTSFATMNIIEDDGDKTFYRKQVSSDYGMAKHLHTEHVMSKHSLKGKMTKFQRLFDRAFMLINLDTEDAVVEGSAIVAKVMINAWVVPKIGHDLAYGLCDYLREMGYVDLLLQFYISPDSKHRVRMAAGRALEECLSGPNRDYVVEKELIDQLVAVALEFKDGEEQRLGVSLFESLFKQSSQTNSRLIELGALDYVLAACNKASTASGEVQLFRHAALALANLSMYSENECQQKMIVKNVPDWLFLLASSHDDITRYYACMAICALVSNKEIEAAVIKSGTLSLVEPFLLANKPADFAHLDYRHNQGRPREWLEKLIPMLSAKRREPRSMAAFHFAMEAGIKKEQDQLEVFEAIGATEALKQVASYPEEVGPKYATMALEIIGAEVPYKLTQQVPLWSIEDVQYWVTQIGFEAYAQTFADQKVDGDLLLLLTDAELEHDIDMKSGLLRKRFMRELESLKMSADYSSIDETQLDKFLVSISPQFSLYTYQLLEKGADRSILPSMSDEVLKNDLGIKNPIYRMRLIQALEECKHIDDMEIAILSRHIDIFISYRRSTGNQLASLIKVLLQLRGYKVFIDVDRLCAGKFDLSLLKNIQAAKHFVLVLTPQALQRCVGDEACHDWVHKEVLCALEHNKNVIPILDPQFEWPDESSLPQDIRVITRFNGVRWVHEYQDACVDKVEKFIKGEFNMNRGFYPHQDRSKRLVNFRSNSSKTSNGGSHSGQMTPSQSVADCFIETLSSHRSRAASREELSMIAAPVRPTASVENIRVSQDDCASTISQ